MEEVRQKVYETIQIFSVMEGGIQIGMLAKMIGLDRSNLNKYLKRLISSNLITKGNGLQGKYMAVKDPSTDSILMADLFAKDFALKTYKTIVCLVLKGFNLQNVFDVSLTKVNSVLKHNSLSQSKAKNTCKCFQSILEN